jgi:hypothetical protein
VGVAPLISSPVGWGTETGVDLSLSSGQRQDAGGGSAHWPDVGRGKECPILTSKSQDSPICPGSGTFPDVVNDLVLDELTYVCAICRASVPNFELAPVHRHALHRATVLTVRLDPTAVGSPTTEMDERCVIEK